MATSGTPAASSHSLTGEASTASERRESRDTNCQARKKQPTQNIITDEPTVAVSTANSLIAFSKMGNKAEGLRLCSAFFILRRK
jgi:hypothetical protein